MTIAVERPQGGRLVDQFEYGLDAPICLTWELTYACNLACVHCLSSSGRRDPRELTTEQCEAVIEELQRAGIELSALPRWPKGSTWILELDGGHAWKGTYLEPLAVEPATQDPLPR